MAYQAVFKRYELKYILTLDQKHRLLEAMAPYMAMDEYGRTTIRNIYYDTENYRLIRHSIEKPAYKEKLRIRSYKKAKPESKVFVELKKKYDHVVYKRRMSLTEEDALGWLSDDVNHRKKEPKFNEAFSEKEAQIMREIDYFWNYYENLHPVIFLSYEREAYYSKAGDDFRVTFDENILCRREEISLKADVWGIPILEEGRVLMELKCSGGIPLWMTHVLSRERIYKTSFSKYGTAYQKLIFPQIDSAATYIHSL